VDCAGALSQHPDAAAATGEVVGSVLERLGTGPDLAVVFCTADHLGALGDVAAAVRSLLQPRVLVGAAAEGVLGGGTEVEDGPGVSLWAARLPVPPRPVRITAARTPSGTAVAGVGAGTVGPGETLVLLADPFTLPVDEVLELLAALDPPARVVGGLCAAGRAPGANRLVLDGEVLAEGAVGVVLPAEAGATTLVSQGCRPVGEPMIVTGARGEVLVELAGRAALDRLDEIVAAAGPDDRRLLARGLHIGIAVDEHRATFGRGDFLVRPVLGAVPSVRGVALGERVEVGTTVQFHVRDAATADEDLREALAAATTPAGAGGALVFTCNGRGRALFGEPHHDARLVRDAVGSDAVAGVFCAGEIGPVGPRSHLHGWTASLLVLGAG
jgi:small ligand-binding sensory domain FIST